MEKKNKSKRKSSPELNGIGGAVLASSQQGAISTKQCTAGEENRRRH
jgi:hypothetical protein